MLEEWCDIAVNGNIFGVGKSRDDFLEKVWYNGIMKKDETVAVTICGRFVICKAN